MQPHSSVAAVEALERAHTLAAHPEPRIQPADTHALAPARSAPRDASGIYPATSFAIPSSFRECSGSSGTR